MASSSEQHLEAVHLWETYVHPEGPNLELSFLEDSNAEKTSTDDSTSDDSTSEKQRLLPGPRFGRLAYISQWIPEVDPDHPRSNTFRTWKSRRQVSLWICSWVAFAVFVINLTCTIVIHMKYPSTNGIGTILTGDESSTSRASTLFHVAINILSSLLLGASNMCMQLCVAPTRSEVDEAHKKCEWLNIGTPSIKNIGWINKGRIALVALLTISSVPLHFLYNSAIFPALAVNDYAWVVANPDFLQGGFYNLTESDPEVANAIIYSAIDSMAYKIVNEPRAFENLTRLQCIERYTSLFGNRSNFIAVSADKSALASDNSVLGSGFWYSSSLGLPGSTLCGWSFGVGWNGGVDGGPPIAPTNCKTFGDLSLFAGNTVAQELANRQKVLETWHLGNFSIDYCLATTKSLKGHYTLGYSLSIMITVCIANGLKFLGILATALWYRKHKGEPTLSTIGDAIASFLEHPDDTTRYLGACSRFDIVQRSELARRAEQKEKPFWSRIFAKPAWWSSAGSDNCVQWQSPPSPLPWRDVTMKPTITTSPTKTWWRDVMGYLKIEGAQRLWKNTDFKFRACRFAIGLRSLGSKLKSSRAASLWKKSTSKKQEKVARAPDDSNREYRWFDGASKSRWALALSLCILTILVGAFLLVQGLISIGSGYGGVPTSAWLAKIYNYGFGEPQSSALIAWGKLGEYSSTTAQFYRCVFFANMWQFIISFLYLLVNALVTSLTVGREWSHLARQRKTLRVTAPKGLQRSSFFVSMPFRFGAPLLASAAVLHWTVSESVFVVRISSYDPDGTLDLVDSVTAVGWSPVAITVSIGLALAIVIAVCCLGCNKYEKGIPLVSTCSAAISAACHPPAEDSDAYYLPVMWGIVASNENGHLHCSFTTARDVRPLGEPEGWKEWVKAPAKISRWTRTWNWMKRKIVRCICWGEEVSDIQEELKPEEPKIDHIVAPWPMLAPSMPP